MTKKLAILGAGVMAEAIARGILRGGVFRASEIIASDIAPARRELFQNQLGIEAVEKTDANSEIVLLCVKPYQMESVLKQLAPQASENSLFISIAAGISTGFIESSLGSVKKWRTIRAMPNTPMLVGAGMVALAPGANATASDLVAAKKLFESAARVIRTTEDKIDAVTAVSGSGPAYFFYLTEQLIQAGVELGLSPEDARTLAIQTALGSAKMMDESPESPAEHRKRVTTPNGTTHAAISHMESKDWAKTTVEAIDCAARRSRELGK